MEMNLFPKIAALAALAGFTALPQAKTLLVLPLEMDTVQIKDYRAIRDFYREALGDAYAGQVKAAAAAEEPCSEPECARKVLQAHGGDEVVYGSVRMLGKKYFFRSAIVDAGGAAFSQQIQVADVEDFEAGTKRMAASLSNRKSLERTADIDNITEKEENLEANRRSSFYSTGGSIGYTLPLGSSYSRWVEDGCDDFDCSGVESYRSPPQLLRLGWNNWYEFKNNLALEMDVLFFAPAALGGDINMNYLFGKTDFTPFAGGGLGIHYVFPDEGSYEDRNKRNSGPTLNAQAGLIMFRTYNMNVVLRGQYHMVFNDDFDQGLSMEVGVRTKMGSSGNKYHRTSATTWIGGMIGVAYLLAILASAAGS